MSGTLEGGKRAAETNIRKYGKDFYSRLGAIGGKAPYSKPKGFAAMGREKASEAGRKGGLISKRGKRYE